MIHSALGALALALLTGALGVAATRGRRALAPTLAGAEALLATAVIALSLLVAELELLGAVGLFRTLPILAVALVLALAAEIVWGAAEAHEATAARPRPAAAALLLGVALAAVLAAWLGPTLVSLRYGIHQFDSIWYHLPWAADYARTGHTTQINDGDVEYLTAFYPATAEMVHGLGIVLLGSDVLSPLLNLGWLALALLAAWCLGARRGAGPAALLGALVALATPMVLASQAGTADNDVTAAALVLCAAALLPPLAGSDRRLILSALAAGLALSTKLTAVPAAAALTVLVIAAAPGGRRRAVAVRWLIPFVLAGGYWYVRDWIAIGTPFPWLHLPGLPEPAPPLQAQTALSAAHYLLTGRSPGVHVVHALDLNLGTAWPALLIALVAVPLLILGRRPSRELAILAGVALLASVAYVVTPQSSAGPSGYPLGFVNNVRYLTPALTLTLVLAGAVGPRRPTPALLGVALILDLARHDQWSFGGQRVLLAVILALALMALLALVWLSRRGGRGGRRQVALIAAGVVAVVLLAHPLERHYLRTRYTYRPHISSLSQVWVRFRSISHARVAVSGTYGGFFDYPLFGQTDTNTVQYLGARGPHGSFTPISSCAAWVATLNAGHYRYLLNTPDRDVWAPARLPATPSADWVQPGPTATLLYRRLVTGQPVTVWRLSGPVPDSACRG